jgi:serine/alanine adding enzyme
MKTRTLTDTDSVSSPLVDSAPLRIHVLEAGDDWKWDAYVAQHPQATLYHLSGWRNLIRTVFGHESPYLYATCGVLVVGVLPLIRLKSRLFGDYLVSMPYFNYGGAMTNSEDVSQLLMEAAAELALELGCSHIEFRDTAPHASWAARTDKVTMELPLPVDAAVLWSGFSPKLRAQIRKPQKEGAEFVRGSSELLPEFYAVFARNMRDLGTPVYAMSFFQEILAAFPKHASIALVRYKRRAVAAGFLLGYRERIEIPWASSLREFNTLGVNMLLYAETLRTAIEDGNRVFDFGRSSVDSGTYRFKKQWGALPRQLYWHYWLSAGRTIPQLNPANQKYRLAIKVWQHLPLVVANRIGPMIVGNLP